MFRIRTGQPAGTLVHTILNAKHQTRGKSCIRDLADGAFLRLFLKPPTAHDSYIDIDLTRLRPTSIEVNHDGRIVRDAGVLKHMAGMIAAQAGWDINDYSLETTPEESHLQAPHLHRLNHSTPDPSLGDQAASSIVLDNPAFAAIHHVIRHFCQDGLHEHLRVGHIRSCAELHDLWAIDREAYGEASITYEKFEDWWRSFPSGLRAIFFRTRVMGAIGIWPLSSSCAGLLKAARLKESEITGRRMRVFKERRRDIGMFQASFCDRNSLAAVQSEFSCRTGLDHGFHRRTSSSRPSCWRLPIPKKARLFWRASISSRYKMPARCQTTCPCSDCNWPTNSNSFRS
jgi:hypothetical protein